MGGGRGGKRGEKKGGKSKKVGGGNPKPSHERERTVSNFCWGQRRSNKCSPDKTPPWPWLVGGSAVTGQTPAGGTSVLVTVLSRCKGSRGEFFLIDYSGENKAQTQQILYLKNVY